MIVTRKQACKLITESLDNDIELTGEKLEAVILAVNSDLQVRDWLMGLPNRWSIEEGIKFMQYMCVHAPSEDLVPFVTLQALYYYELGNTEKTTGLLNYALRLDKDYSLAQLLLRVFRAGWPAEQFAVMRDELDPKIIEACYGPEGATTIKENGELQYVMYKVTIHDHIIYDYMVEADSLQEAIDRAEDTITNDESHLWVEDEQAGWTEIGSVYNEDGEEI